MIYSKALREGIDKLKAASIQEYESDARILFEWATGLSRSEFILKANEELDDKLYANYKLALARRIEKIPVQYITGTQCFMGYDFLVNENVLIPRFDTEILVEQVLKRLKAGDRLLDICTGSGCIAISLKLLAHNIECTATDISEAALEIARQNAIRYDLNDIKFVRTDLLEGLEGEYDVIVSNPPYIESHVVEELADEVKNREPRLALDGGADGLVFYRRLVEEAWPHVKSGGLMAFEIGYNQGIAVTSLMKDVGMTDIEIIKDYAGLDRVVLGIKM